MSRHRDLYFDLAGGNRIPKSASGEARTIAELREAGVGVRHILLVHYNTLASSDLFAAALTMLDPMVLLTVRRLSTATARRRKPIGGARPAACVAVEKRGSSGRRTRRRPGETLAAMVRELDCDLLIVGEEEALSDEPVHLDCKELETVRPVPLRLLTLPAIPHETES